MADCREQAHLLRNVGSLEKLKKARTFLQEPPEGGSDGKEYASNAGDLGSILGQEDPLEK